ncbi:MAG TPA: hypothetical protein VE397_21380 [Stellaceae bacterium]|jgi:hypothetical protein|nr:hypothetical protein [Stellaceae bacterium]
MVPHARAIDWRRATDTGALFDALAFHIRTEMGGWANRQALVRVDRLIGELMAAVDLSDCDRHRLQQIRDWAGILYSTRRHRCWETGAVSLRRTMLRDVESLRRMSALPTNGG